MTQGGIEESPGREEAIRRAKEKTQERLQRGRRAKDGKSITVLGKGPYRGFWVPLRAFPVKAVGCCPLARISSQPFRFLLISSADNGSSHWRRSSSDGCSVVPLAGPGSVFLNVEVLVLEADILSG